MPSSWTRFTSHRSQRTRHDPRLGRGGRAAHQDGQPKDFRDALLYVNAIGYLAEQANHHPDIAISWNKVTLHLVTHSAGGLTAKDFALARQISELG